MSGEKLSKDNLIQLYPGCVELLYKYEYKMYFLFLILWLLLEK